MKFASLLKSTILTKMNKPFVGFVAPSVAPYNQAMASTRIRCYDVISYLNKHKIYAEFYNASRKYKVVVFQKAFLDHHIDLARKLKVSGVTVVFDINVNYVKLENEALNYVKPEQKSQVLTMLKLSDIVIAESKKNGEIYREYHDKVIVIEESIDDNFFKVHKYHENSQSLFLLYCGYSIKASEVLLIKETLKRLHDEFSVEMLYVCEKDPEINIIPYKFIQFSYQKLPEILMKGDIKVAPRNLSNSYNWGHSFTKVAYPMAVGVPAVASPVPSYLNRKVTICNTPSEWYNSLRELILSAELRNQKGAEGTKEVKINFSIDTIGPQYIKLFKKYL